MTTQNMNHSTAQRLQEAYARRELDGYEPLWALSKALRDAGWSLHEIASTAGVSRETPRNWSIKAEELGLPIPTVEPPVRPVARETIKSETAAVRRDIRERREKVALEKNLPRLLELKPQAEALRGPSMFSPDRAAASAEYTRLIDETLKAGARGRVLAEALGVQQITLHARLRRSGLRKKSPTERIPAWAQTAEWQKGA